jgi:serine/threonine protein kinase
MIGTGTFLQQRYRIDKQIGQGGMGAVYVATDERFASTVAIKETLCMDDNFRKALEREARLLNSLKHSALPRVSDHFIEDDGQFLVMEFVPGMDLMQTLESRNAPFPYEQVLNWADQLLDALEYLHTQENPVVHRDIKPQNLKVTSKGQVVLLDFGLAKGNVTDAGSLTAAKSIFGYSRNYASLEQIQGTGTDPRSDLYSLAATLYHLMTGVAPEDALTRAMAVLSHQPDPLLPASSVNPAIPVGLSNVLQKAMDLSAGRRPANAAELRERLRNHEQFANQTNPAISYPATGTQNSVFGAPTIANQESTFAAVGGSEALTQLLPENVSKVTSVRDARSNGERVAFVGDRAQPKRKAKYAVVGIIAVLAACLLSAGLYLNQIAASIEPSQEAPPVTDQPDQQAGSISNVSAADPGLANTDSAANAASFSNASAPTEKRSTTLKTPQAPNVPKTQSDANSDPGDNDDNLVVNGDILTVGNVKIEKGKIWSNGREYNFNMPPPPNVRIPDIQTMPRALTPEQRRKLRMLRQQHPETFQRPSPTPRN